MNNEVNSVVGEKLPLGILAGPLIFLMVTSIGDQY